MENISIKALEVELKNFFKNEHRTDPIYRFCLLFSQLGDLFHYLTHDQILNPKARSLGSKQDEKVACAQALMQLLMSITIINMSVLRVFKKAFVIPWRTTSLTIEDVEKKITQISSRVSSIFDTMNRILKVNKYASRLENNHLNINAAATTLKALAIYITVRGFSFKEVLLLGLQNQRDREWAKTVVEETKETDDNKLFGIIGIPGEVSGKAYVVDNKHPLSAFPSGEILVTSDGKPEHVEDVYKAAGVITDNGGKTCHMVNILLPKGTVCLVGTGSATKKIKHGQIITIHALDENGSNQGQGYVLF